MKRHSIFLCLAFCVVMAASSAAHAQFVHAAKRGDFDGDNKADILLRDPFGNLGRWYMDGPHILSGGPIQDNYGWVNALGMTISTGDFYGDGHADVLTVDLSGSPYLVGLWRPIPTCRFGGCIDPLQGIGDFDGDSHSDLLMRDASGNVRMWTFTNGGMGGRQLYNTDRNVALLDPSYTIVAVDDFDGDGKADILIRDTVGNIGVWLMDREVIASGGYSGTASSSLHIAGTGDFDGDGKADILFVDDFGNIGIWFMSGATIARGAWAAALPAGYRIVAVNDYDGDGKCDILLRATNGDVGMLLMDGAVVREGAFVSALDPGYDLR